MASHVSYISSNGGVGEKVATAKNKTLSFDVKGKKGSILYDKAKPTSYGDNSQYTRNNLKINTDASQPFTNLTLDKAVRKMNKSVFLPNNTDTVVKSLEKYAKYYNRFKIADPNVQLQKGFAHVFFVRPSCHILKSKSPSQLRKGLAKNELFSYAHRSSHWLLRELSSTNGQDHDFMLFLSNYAASFSLSDEYINTDTYGKTYTGYKIAYGKSNIESKVAGQFNVTFNDDRNLHVYQLHRLWTEYINAVYRGEIAPTDNMIKKKILDYVGACYYIVTAEDGETVIFWSKYYGVFPTNVPSSQYSWGAGNVIQSPQIDITYQFSFKEDYNPYSILEFNYNSRVGSTDTNYVPIYDNKVGHVGKTWVGAPFIELITRDSAPKYELKLRFKPK